MILGFLKFIHVAFGLIGIGSGIIVLLGALITGKLLQKWTGIFLKCALATSVTGLLFPSSHFLSTHRSAMFGVYVAALAILAWRKLHLAGVWGLIFALSVICILGLSIFVAVVHAFTFIPALRALGPTQSELPFRAAEIAAALPFVALGIFAIKRFHDKPTRSLQ
jgi:hypothetical protein